MYLRIKELFVFLLVFLIEGLIVSCETSRKRKARKMNVWYLASFFVFKLPCGFCGRLLVFLMCF